MVQLKEAAVVVIILSLMASLGVNIKNYTNDEGIIIDEGYLPYTCEREDIPDYLCYKLSKIGTTGVNRNCYYDRARSKKYKVCSTGWELIKVLDSGDCSEKECPVIEPESCPYCPPQKICPEPVTCPICSGGGGGGTCPSCPTCNDDGTTVCTEIIGFMSIPDVGKYYCRNCGIDGCDECVINDDIMMDFDMTLYD